MRHLLCPLLVSALAGLGCGPDAQTAQSSTSLSGLGARDSIFVEDWPELRNAHRDPAFAYRPSDPGASPLFRVRSMIPRPAGGVYVANAGSHELLAVDAGGGLQWRAGRQGDGPGEFRSLGPLQLWRGDTLIAIDQRRSTASFWTASGEHIRARSVPPVASGPLFSDRVYTFQQPRLFGLLENERFAFLGPERVVLEGESGRRPIQSSILAADAVGNVHDLIDLPGGWAYEPVRPGSFPIAGFAPMSAPLAVAVQGDGFVWARADRYEIVQFDHDGQVMRVFGVRQPLDRVTDSLRRSYLESSSYRTWFPVEETLPFPSTLPAFDRTFVSSSGAIWARRFSWGGAPEEWIYFTVAPVAVFRVRFPSRVQIMTATADAAYGVWRDELDVEHLVRFQVQPEPPPL